MWQFSSQRGLIWALSSFFQAKIKPIQRTTYPLATCRFNFVDQQQGKADVQRYSSYFRKIQEISWRVRAVLDFPARMRILGFMAREGDKMQRAGIDGRITRVLSHRLFSGCSEEIDHRSRRISL